MADDGTTHCGDGVADLMTGFVAYPPSNPPDVGWQIRQGKQYDLGLSPGCNATTLFGIPVDLDVFDPSLFMQVLTRPTHRAPGQ